MVVVQDPKVTGSAGLGAAAGLQAACQAVSDPNFVGQPQLRLSHFAAPFRSFERQRLEGNVCEPENYLDVESSFLATPDICYRMLVTLDGL